MITVNDIMQTDVVSVTPDMTARHLARVLADHEISGTPVVDAADRLVGVVSSTDLVRLAASDDEVHLTASALRAEMPQERDPDDEVDVDPDPYDFFLPEESIFMGHRFLASVPQTAFDTVPVSDLMTPVSFSVPPDTSIQDISEFLVRGRIHRAVVVEGEKLLGIVTSNDILRALSEGRLEE
jgi:CBS domain-containing protein